MMIDFNRFWMEGNRFDEDADEDAPEDAAEVPPGVTERQILAWERENGVTLPEPIRTALGRRNGGFVRNTNVEILPLDAIPTTPEPRAIADFERSTHRFRPDLSYGGPQSPVAMTWVEAHPTGGRCRLVNGRKTFQIYEK